MRRTIIRIDEDKCDGCGDCVRACHEGAIRLIDGKARLVSETYCDGLGACLGECPQGAISMEQREAEGFVGPAPGSPATVAANPPAVPGDVARAAFARAMDQAPVAHGGHSHGGGCPGSALRDLRPDRAAAATAPTVPASAEIPAVSHLSHWPVQLMLVPPGAPFLKGADLVVCADCVPFAVPDFHARYLQGRSIVVGCPKLDDLPHYHEKLAAIVAAAGPRSLTVVRMEVPCCGGIVRALVDARNSSAPGLPVEVHTVGIGGGITRQVV